MFCFELDENIGSNESSCIRVLCLLQAFNDKLTLMSSQKHRTFYFSIVLVLIILILCFYFYKIKSQEIYSWREFSLIKKSSVKRVNYYGGLLFSSNEDYRLAEALIHPAMNLFVTKKILIIGDEIGSLLREALKYNSIQEAHHLPLYVEFFKTLKTTKFSDDLNASAYKSSKVFLHEVSFHEFINQQKQTYSRKTFDLVVFSPSVTNINEIFPYFKNPFFFKMISEWLTPKGILIIKLADPYQNKEYKLYTKPLLSKLKGFQVYPFLTHLIYSRDGVYFPAVLSLLITRNSIELEKLELNKDVSSKYLDNVVMRQLFHIPKDLAVELKEIL